ncbi:uracil-DNA glycosylase [candidate division KSB1 bacterium]|nr:uracil-DNA glycosylase [candidate division KSB1 bacterium]
MHHQQAELNTLLAQTKQYFRQQAELYGDDFFISLKSENLHPPVQNINSLEQTVKNCQKCSLFASRRNVVFGAGNHHAKLMIISSMPDKLEDAQGEPFTGEVGELLDKILGAIQFSRDEVYITHILKCKPPEITGNIKQNYALCKEYLWQQIEIIQPRIILALGQQTAQVLLNVEETINQLRGKIHQLNGVDLIVTYHPATLLKQPEFKRSAWEDVKLLRQHYDALLK